MKKIFGEFGSDPEFYQNNLLIALLFFIIAFIIDTYVQTNMISAVSVCLVSKLLIIVTAGWLTYINYLAGRKITMWLWILNVLLALVLSVGIISSNPAVLSIVLALGIVIVATALYLFFLRITT